MFATLLPEVLLGLGSGVAGVVLIVIGVPTCVAAFGRSILRAYRRRRLERAAAGVFVTAAVGVLGAALWGFALTTAPGVYDEPLGMLAMTFLPFTIGFALLGLVAQHYSSSQARRTSRIGLMR